MAESKNNTNFAQSFKSFLTLKSNIMGELYRETRAKHQIQYLIIRHQCQREKEDEFLFAAVDSGVTNSFKPCLVVSDSPG